MNKILLKVDSRDSDGYMKFGQILDFPKELNFDSPLIDEVQPIGDVKCTCYTTCNIAEDQFKTYYDINDLWKRVPSVPQGADPRDVLGEAVRNGLLPKNITVNDITIASSRVKNWNSYYRADTGSFDAFDNVRSMMTLINCPVGVGTYWYYEWINSAEVLPEGKTKANGHMYQIEGWKEIMGEPYFIVEAWIGKKLYMSRKVFNLAMKPYGVGAWVLSMASREKVQISILENIRDVCLNIIIKLRELIELKKKLPPIKEVYPEILMPSLLDKFCEAIKTHEGFFKGSRSERNNNAGNCKYSSVGYDKKYGIVRVDEQGFAIFQTYEIGFTYLKNLVISKCKKHPNWTFYQFFEEYAPQSENDSKHYAETVAHACRVLPTTQIKNLTS